MGISKSMAEKILISKSLTQNNHKTILILSGMEM